MEKQTKPEPLGKSMAKLVLVVAVLVSAAVIIGVAGYLVANKPKTTLPVMPLNQEKVIISTDKTEYEQGEIVKFTAKNNLSSDYELHWPYFEIENKENSQWKKITTSDCDCLNVECKIDRSLKILHKEEIFSEEWNLKTVKCGKEYGSESLISDAGIYRVKFIGRITSHTHFSLDYFYSNEFTIKEKPVDETADWKTYRNDKYGFEVKYPSEFTLSSRGPNSAQEAIDRGEQISGTVAPSYDTIIFSNDYVSELGRIEIFYKYEKDLLEENYKGKGYLYLFGPCDIRWEFKPEFFSLNLVNNIKILTVKGKNQEGVSQHCNYLKNSDGNLIVISNKEYKSEVFDQILSTFKFIEKDEVAE